MHGLRNPLALRWQRLAVRAWALAAGVFALSLLAVALRPADSTAATWWPASALAVAAVVLARAQERGPLTLAVLAATAAANLAAGRPVLLAAALGVANAAEAILASWAFTRTTGGRARFRTVDDALRLLCAALIAASAAGVLAGLGTLLAEPDVLTTMRTVAFAHAAAILLAVPLLLLDASTVRLPRRRGEAVLEWLGLVLAAACVFAPQQTLPLTFLPLPFLVWAAVRLPARNALLQMLALGVAASVGTMHGYGPLAHATAGDDALAVSLVQLFLATNCLVLVPLTMAVQQRREDTGRLRASEELFRLSFEEALVGMAVLRYSSSAGGLRVARVNDVAAQVVGVPAPRLPGLLLTDLVHPDDLPVLTAAVEQVVGNDFGAWRGELRVRETSTAGDGASRWMEMALTRLPSYGRSIVASAQLLDVTDRRATQRRLHDLAMRDGLTGLPNRLALAQRVSAAQRGADDVPHALLFCDLDGFKAVNDGAGHAAGDALLVEVAQRLEVAVRSGDTVARLGGDEFAVFCPGLTVPEAEAVARRVVAALDGPVLVDGVEHRVGVSVGVAPVLPGGTLQAALNDADTAMYASKTSGRGRVTLAEAAVSPTG